MHAEDVRRRGARRALGDGCGGLLNCGTCGVGQICGALEANKCGGIG